MDAEVSVIKVLVVDDHTLFAEGTVLLLSTEPRISVVGTAKNAQECISLAVRLIPDIILLDINLPDFTGIDIIDELYAIVSNVKVIMLTGIMNPVEYVKTSLSKGVQGFLLKDCSRSEIVEAITTVFEGGTYLPETLSALNNPEQNDSSTFTLTSRETEIMDLVAKGLQNKEIAFRLNVNFKTVDFHIGNILKKLRVKSRLEAVLIWQNIKGKTGYF